MKCLLDVNEIADGVSLGEDGLWFSKAGSAVHYPEEGSQWCQQIEEKSFWFKHRNNCILASMAQFPPTGAFIDIGGGNGFVALTLKDAGYSVALLEPGVVGARFARKRGIDPVICSTVEDAGFKNNCLSAVGLFDVLEHCPTDIDFLMKIRNLLVRRGRLYITVPAYNLLWSTDDDFAQHFRRYTLAGLGSALKCSGFSIEYCTYFFSILPVPIFLCRTLPGRLGLRKKSELAQESDAHNSPSGILGGLFNQFLKKELCSISRKERIPFGGSCLVVASAL